MKTAHSISLLQFETNTNCNAQCSFCAHKSMKRKGNMPLWQIADLTFNLAPYASTICPFWMQEPLMEPRLPEILSNCKTNNPKAQTCVFSNMSLYPKQMLKRIMNMGTLDVFAISFYGQNKKEYEELQPPLNYETTVKNIKNFAKLRNSLRWAKPKIVLKQLITEPALNQKYLNRWAGIVDCVELSRMDNWCGENKTFNEQKERAMWGPKPHRVPCSQLYARMYIQSDGTVCPCCLDHEGKYALGNVFKDGFDVWFRSEPLKEMRRLHEEGRWDEIDLCAKCNQWEYREDVAWIKQWENQKQLTVPSVISR